MILLCFLKFFFFCLVHLFYILFRKKKKEQWIIYGVERKQSKNWEVLLKKWKAKYLGRNYILIIFPGVNFEKTNPIFKYSFPGLQKWLTYCCYWVPHLAFVAWGHCKYAAVKAEFHNYSLLKSPRIYIWLRRRWLVPGKDLATALAVPRAACAATLSCISYRCCEVPANVLLNGD